MAGRSYNINNVEWPSVTTVLGLLDKGDALLQWGVNCALAYVREHAVAEDFETVLLMAKTHWREARDEAADIGKEIHELIKVYIRHGRDAVGVYRPEVENGFLAFLQWELDNGIEWLEAEKQVFDGIHGYAGTLDAKCRFTKGAFVGRVFVIDFKSSKGIYDGYAEQVAAYRHADSLATSVPADGCGILRLDKETGIPEFKDTSGAYEEKLAFFLKLLECFYMQKNRRLAGNPLILGAKRAAEKATLAELKARKAA